MLSYREQGEEDSGYVTERFLRGIAEQVPGLNLRRWSLDRHKRPLRDELHADERAAEAAHFEGTPSFLIGRTGRPLRPFAPDSFSSSESFERKIDKIVGAEG